MAHLEKEVKALAGAVRRPDAMEEEEQERKAVTGPTPPNRSNRTNFIAPGPVKVEQARGQERGGLERLRRAAHSAIEKCREQGGKLGGSKCGCSGDVVAPTNFDHWRGSDG